MKEFDFLPARIKGLCRIWPCRTQDARGYFLKSFEKDAFYAQGIGMDVQESFETQSKKGVLRGLHFQSQAPQAKLIRALQGRVFDVAVDLRKGSATFLQWEGFVLDDEEHCGLYIPPGFAHGFLVLSDTARVSYQCAGRYLADADTGIVWNDPDLAVKWPVHLVDGIVLSPRDQSLPSLQACMQSGRLPNEEEKE